MTNQTHALVCPQCSAEIDLFHRPVIDEGLFGRFLSGPLNPTSCHTCGLKIHGATPCLVERNEWSAVVLANPAPIGIDKATEVVDYFIHRVPGLSEGKQPILVVGTEDQLRRILHRFPGEHFNAVPFAHFLSREWDIQIESVKIASDACLAANKPELGYAFLIEALGLFNELYLHPVIREALELAVLAAGDRISPDLGEPSRPAEHFA